MGKEVDVGSLIVDIHYVTACIGRLVLLAMVVTGYMLILLALLTRVGCHDREYDTYSNMMENRMKNFGHNELMGMSGIGSLQQCLNSERKSSVALLDPTNPLNLDDGNVSCPAWSVKHSGSSKCECGNDLHGKITCCQNLEKLLIFQCFCVTYDNITDREAQRYQTFCL